MNTTNKICQHQFSPKVRTVISGMHLRIFYEEVYFFFSVSAAEKKERENSQHPVFMVKLMNSTLITDSSASLMVHVRGNPNPDVKL